MPPTISEEFIKESAKKSFDLDHRNTMNKRVQIYNKALEKGAERFFNLENSKSKANLLKWKVIENLDRYLLAFETNFTANGGHVLWANNILEAQQEVLKIINKKSTKTVVTSKSQTIEEIELYAFFNENGIKFINSDTIKASSVESSAFDSEDRSQQTLKPLEHPRERLLETDISITSANFLISESGSIVFSENSGNLRLSNTFAKTHIIICGIEKILPTLSDLDLFWPLLSTHSTGQNITTFNSIISGPRRINESEGPEEMHIILLDNGRTNLLKQKEQRQGLYCIQCNSCLNVCPVYHNIGGVPYGTTYKGPIGSLVTPHTKSIKNFKHLSEASSLCGKCTEVCPVGIDIHKMLLLNRKSAIEEGRQSSSEVKFWKLYTLIFNNRRWLDLFGRRTKTLVLKYLFKKSWGKRRNLPPLPKQSFSKQWKTINSKKE